MEQALHLGYTKLVPELYPASTRGHYRKRTEDVLLLIRNSHSYSAQYVSTPLILVQHISNSLKVLMPPLETFSRATVLRAHQACHNSLPPSTAEYQIDLLPHDS